MKYIFCIHSHITFLISKSYIEQLNIAHNDCIFLCSRNYKINEEQFASNSYSCNIFPNSNELSPIPNPFKARKQRLLLEKKISKLTQNQTFIIYLFYTASHFASIIVSMRNCVGYYIIEEGTSAYRDKKDLFKFFTGIKGLITFHILNPFFRKYYLLKDFCFSTNSPKYKGVVCSSDDAFPYLGNEKIIVTNLFNKCDLGYSPNIVLSIDYSIELFHMKDEDIDTILSILHKYISLHYNNPIIAYKFHPYYFQKEEKKNRIETYLQKHFVDIQHISLDKSVILEEVLNTYHSDFYSDFSSVGIYAHNMHCKCYSYTTAVLHKISNKAYLNAFNSLPYRVSQLYIQL